MATLRVREPFSYTRKDGVAVVMSAGDVVDSKDPVVKGREALFEDVADVVAARAGGVEQATAAPGEKRSVTKAASKSAAKKS